MTEKKLNHEKPDATQFEIIPSRPMTPKDLAHFLQISTSTLFRWIRSKPDFPRHVFCKNTYFFAAEVLEYIKNASENPTQTSHTKGE